MAKYSKTNTWSDTDGNRWTSAQVEYRINQAKERKIEYMKDDYGYLFCEDCMVSNSVWLDCSHEKSVKECKEEGRVELCWDTGNIKMRCRECHQRHDGLK